MRVTRHSPLGSLALVAALLFVLALGGCAGSASPGEGEVAPTAGETTIPATVLEVLARDNIVLTEASFADGVTSAEVMEAFSREYGTDMSDQQPVAYAAKVVSSDESRLKPGALVRLIHLPGVTQQVTPPSPPPGEEQGTSVTIATDMFAFFDPESGELLLTVFIGPTN